MELINTSIIASMQCKIPYGQVCISCYSFRYFDYGKMSLPLRKQRDLFLLSAVSHTSIQGRCTSPGGSRGTAHSPLHFLPPPLPGGKFMVSQGTVASYPYPCLFFFEWFLYSFYYLLGDNSRVLIWVTPLLLLVSFGDPGARVGWGDFELVSVLQLYVAHDSVGI